MMEEFAVAWCRCGPMRTTLERALTVPAGASVLWKGRRRWVDASAIHALGIGSLVWLGVADLCHWGSHLLLLREARILETNEDRDAVAITLRCNGDQRAWLANGGTLRSGKLVGPLHPVQRQPVRRA
jgi:hypothetical protein